MKKEEFQFNSRDNRSRIHAVRYLPDDMPSANGGEIICVLQIVHGMSEYVERYEEFARFLTDRGCVVTGADHLGHGKTVQDGETYGYFCQEDPVTVVVRDVHRLKKITQQLYPSVPYIILGHSMGSFILRNYICRYGSGIQGAIIMGTGTQPGSLIGVSRALAAVIRLFKGDKHVSNFLNQAAFGKYNKRIENAATRFDWLSKNEKKVEQYIKDPLCGFVFTINGFQTLFGLISRAQDSERIKEIPVQLPVLLTAGKEDPVGGYGAGVEKVYEVLVNAGLQRVQCKLYDEDRHEILNETDADTVMQDIYHWMLQVITK